MPEPDEIRGHAGVPEQSAEVVDVVILGAGLAGSTLSRHLLLDTERSVLLLERRSEVPGPHQKVGESTVQVAGYYYSRVLDLEEYLFRHHYMKYNLRFYWPSQGRDNSRFEDYSQSYIRPFSNIPSYQLDRNVFERDLLAMNQENPRFALVTGAKPIEVELATQSEVQESAVDAGQFAEPDLHRVRYQVEGSWREVWARWVVDTTGRGKQFARRMDLGKENSIRHAAFYWWVDGLVDVDRLTDRSPREIRRKRDRQSLGHLPTWLATNHFCDEGLWFWVIPLQGKTSLGLVFDKSVVDHRDVFSVEKATRFVCERFPCFARDLPQRQVIDFGGHRDFSYDCKQTIDADRWALTGEAGRFTDPLYSPGSDLISIYNTLVVDAIQTEGRQELGRKCRQYEQVMRAVYSAYEPGYAISYDTLGDAEAFSLKYVWELTTYFAFYVFPFINDLFTDRRFLLAFMRRFSQLGPVNRGVQKLLSGYFQWKRERGMGPQEPVFFDFMEIGSLKQAERTFYEVGVSTERAKQVLGEQLGNLEELARFMVAHVASEVLGQDDLLVNRAFVESIDLQAIDFEPEAWAQQWQHCSGQAETWQWSFDATIARRFRTQPEMATMLTEVAS